MITTHEIYGRVHVDRDNLSSTSDFVEVKLINKKDILGTDVINVGKVALKDKGGYISKNRPNSLVEQFLPLAYGAASHHCRGGYGNRYDWEELLQVGCVGLCTAAEQYDNTKNNGFVAYAKPYVHGYIKNFINPERNGLMNMVEMSEGFLDDLQADEYTLDVEEDNLNMVLYGAIEELTAKQKFAVEMVHIQGHTQEQVSNMMEIAPRRVRDLLERANKALKKSLFDAFK